LANSEIRCPPFPLGPAPGGEKRQTADEHKRLPHTTHFPGEIPV